MKRFALAAVAVITLTGAAWADPLEGMWRTVADDNGNSGLIEVAPCGPMLPGGPIIAASGICELTAAVATVRAPGPRHCKRSGGTGTRHASRIMPTPMAGYVGRCCLL